MSILIDHPRAPEDIGGLVTSAPGLKADVTDRPDTEQPDTDLTVDEVAVDEVTVIDAREIIDLRLIESGEPAEPLVRTERSEPVMSDDSVTIDDSVAPDEPVLDEPGLENDDQQVTTLVDPMASEMPPPASPSPASLSPASPSSAEQQPAPVAALSIFGDLRAQQRQALIDLLFMPVDELPAHVVAPRIPLFPTMQRREQLTAESAGIGVLGLRPPEDTPVATGAPVVIGLESGQTTTKGSIDFVAAAPAGNGPLIRRIALLLRSAAVLVIVLVVLWSLLSGSGDTATVTGDEPVLSVPEEEPATTPTTIPKPVVTTAVIPVETSASSLAEPEPVAPEPAPVTRAATPTTRASRPSTQAPRTPSTGAAPATNTTTQSGTTLETLPDFTVEPPTENIFDPGPVAADPPTTVAPAATTPTSSAPATNAPTSQPPVETTAAAD